MDLGVAVEILSLEGEGIKKIFKTRYISIVMWTTKISFDGTKENVLARYAKKHNVRVLIFPLSWIYESDWIILNITGTLYGEVKNRKRFIQNWKKSNESVLLDVEVNRDLFVGVVKEHIDARVIYNRNIIFTRPLLIDENGFETIVVNSFEKKYLEDFIDVMDKYHSVNVHYIRKEKVSNISFRINSPNLTEKQKGAMDLAVRDGYYKYPRKTSIKGLAKKSKLGFATFHAHLRKAEQKLMPFFFSQ